MKIMKVELFKSTGRIARTIVGGFLVLLLSSCNSVFDIHPYDVNVHGEKDINAKQMKVIESMFTDKKTLRVAFISDTHLWLADAKDQVADINKRGDIDFVVHCGDLTDTATNDEFEWSRDILYGLNYPFVALIGNHDFLGTGDQTYEVMYGAFNFSFMLLCRTSTIWRSSSRRIPTSSTVLSSSCMPHHTATSLIIMCARPSVVTSTSRQV